MKTKEFISKINEVAGITIELSNTGILIYNLDRKIIGWVSIDDFGAVDTSDIDLDNMKNKNEVVNLMLGYASTPLSEREDETKFRVRMLPGEFNDDTYLNQDRRNKGISLNELDEMDDFQTIFTKSEYDKLRQKYSKWLPKFDEKDPHFEFLDNKEWKIKGLIIIDKVKSVLNELKYQYKLSEYKDPLTPLANFDHIIGFEFFKRDGVINWSKISDQEKSKAIRMYLDWYDKKEDK